LSSGGNCFSRVGKLETEVIVEALDCGGRFNCGFNYEVTKSVVGRICNYQEGIRLGGIIILIKYRGGRIEVTGTISRRSYSCNSISMIFDLHSSGVVWRFGGECII
jgi:hypothetical protein